MHRRVVILLLSTIILLGAQCSVNPHSTKNNFSQSPTPINTWQEIAPGLQRIQYPFGIQPYDAIFLFAFTSQTYTFHFENGEPKHIRDWNTEKTQPTILLNGVYFHEDNMPSGLLIHQGEKIGKRRFESTRSGFLELRPHLRIIDTEQEPLAEKTIMEGAQSFPFIIRNGKRALNEEVSQKARRTFVGIDRNNTFYIGIVPDTNVSLFALANILMTMGIAWEDVLNLDGGGSSGLAINVPNHQEMMDSYNPVPNVIIGSSK